MKVDVLVIGGGIIGVSSAFYLAQEGREVVLIEREEAVCPVSSSTYANAGMISPTGVYPLPHPGVLGQGFKWLLDSSSCFYIKPQLNAGLALWLLRFMAASREGPMSRGMPILRDLGVAGLKLFGELHDTGALDGGYEHNGILNLYNTQAAFQAALDDIEPMKAFNIETEVVDAQEVRRRAPAAMPSVVGGTYVPEDAHLDPCAFTRELARVAAEKGAKIMTFTEALDFSLSGRKITCVRTTQGNFEPGTVVLAAGVWSASLAKRLHLRVPLQPSKGYSVTIKRPEGVPEHLPLYLTEAHVCVTPFGEELRLAGTLELSGVNYRVLDNRVAGIRKGASDFLAGVSGEPQRIWRALRPLSPDGIPIVGRSARHDNLVVATGHNMNGIKFGPITGKLVAEIVTAQRPSVNLYPMRPERFAQVGPI